MQNRLIPLFLGIIIAFALFSSIQTVKADLVSENLFVCNFMGEIQQTTRVGNYPWLSMFDNDTSYIMTTTMTTYKYDQYYIFQHTNITSITGAWLQVCARQATLGVYGAIQIYYWTGSDYSSPYGWSGIYGTSWQNLSAISLGGYGDTQNKINSMRVKIGLTQTSASGYELRVTTMWLHVEGYITTVTEPTPSVDYTFLVNLVVPLLFMFVPALILASFLGSVGIIGGLALGILLLVVCGWLPYWTLFFIGLIIILFIFYGKRREAND